MSRSDGCEGPDAGPSPGSPVHSRREWRTSGSRDSAHRSRSEAVREGEGSMAARAIDRQIHQLQHGGHTCLICQNPRRRFQPAQICDALRSHPLAIVGDQLYPSLYYEPPELLLGRDADKGLDAMIERLAETWGAMQGLREGEARYRSLLEADGVGVVVVDDAGTVVEANDSYLT